MPIFEYRCGQCDHQFELLIRPGSATPACPSCGSTSIQRVISMFAVSSDDTSRRSRKKLGVQTRRKSEAAAKEREFYKTDHHDD